MKKTIKSIAALLVILTLCVGLLAGCSSDPIVGKWTNSQGGVMILNANGSCEMINNGVSTNQPGTKVTWEHSGDKLIVKIVAEGTDFSLPVEMNIKSFEGDTLVLVTAGVEQTFTRS